MMTTYPLGVAEVGDAKSWGFQRYDQSSPQAPCGPPWIRYFSGYVLLLSKLGGRMMKPCTFSLAAPVYQKVSIGCISTFDSTSSLRWVSGLAFVIRQSGTV